MLSKKGYLIHFARIFFASILLGICSFLSHLWNKSQPLYLAFQFQQCQSTLSPIQNPQINIWNWLNHFHFTDLFPSFSFISISKCHLYIQNDYPLNLPKYLGLIHSIVFIYLIYHLICLSLFHAHIQQIQTKQISYAHLYRQKTTKI